MDNVNICILLNIQLGERGVKRFNDGYSGGPPKRSKLGPDEIEIRVLIPSKVSFSIIW